MIKYHHPACACKVLHQFNALRIVLPLDVFVVIERLMNGRAVVELETVDVEGNRILLASEVLYFAIAILPRPILASGWMREILIYIEPRLRSICWSNEISELSENGGWFFGCDCHVELSVRV